jgi:hypothetical protein
MNLPANAAVQRDARLIASHGGSMNGELAHAGFAGSVR